MLCPRSTCRAPPARPRPTKDQMRPGHAASERMENRAVELKVRVGTPLPSTLDAPQNPRLSAVAGR
jgi:hypothetical protein